MDVKDLFSSELRRERNHEWRLIDASYDSKSSVETFISKTPSTKEQRAWLKLLDETALHGAEALPAGNRHEIDKTNCIYELIKGSYRVAYFYDNDQIIVLTHGFRKKTQATPDREKNLAKRIKNRYLNAKNDGSLKFLEE